MSSIVEQPTAGNAVLSMEPGINDVDAIWRLAAAAVAARALHVIAEIGVADHVADSPRSAADLAAEVGAEPRRVGQGPAAALHSGSVHVDAGRLDS